MMDVDAELYSNPPVGDVVDAAPNDNPTENEKPEIITEESLQKLAAEESGEKKELVSFVLNFNKKPYPIEWPADDTVMSLKEHIGKLTGVPSALQKLMFKGLVKDNGKTLRETGIGNGAKLMLVGSTVTQVKEVNEPQQKAVLEEEAPKQEALCEQTKHKKILEKGLPDNVMAGIAGRHEPLPSTPLVGVYNNRGTPVRLTFKELWISSTTNTQQLPFGSIKTVISEPIKGKEEYHIMSLQLGASENTKYFLYYVPAQYTRAIKNTIMGYI